MMRIGEEICDVEERFDEVFLMFDDAEVVVKALLLLESCQSAYSFFVFSLETNNLFDDDDENDDNEEEVALATFFIYICQSVSPSVCSCSILARVSLHLMTSRMENSSLFSSGNPKRGRGINLLGTTECTTGDTIHTKKKKKLKKRLQESSFFFHRARVRNYTSRSIISSRAKRVVSLNIRQKLPRENL